MNNQKLFKLVVLVNSLILVFFTSPALFKEDADLTQRFINFLINFSIALIPFFIVIFIFKFMLMHKEK